MMFRKVFVFFYAGCYYSSPRFGIKEFAWIFLFSFFLVPIDFFVIFFVDEIDVLGLYLLISSMVKTSPLFLGKILRNKAKSWFVVDLYRKASEFYLNVFVFYVSLLLLFLLPYVWMEVLDRW